MSRLNRANGRVLPYRYRHVAAALCAALSVGACAGGQSVYDSAVPTASDRPLAQATTPDGYPNINVVPRGEGPQFTAAQKAALMSDLAAARARQAAGDNSPATAAEIARLRQLARIHAAEALREIEGS